MGARAPSGFFTLHPRTQSRLYCSQLRPSTWCLLTMEEIQGCPFSLSPRALLLLAAGPLPCCTFPAGPAPWPASAPDSGVFTPLGLFYFSLLPGSLLDLPRSQVKAASSRGLSQATQEPAHGCFLPESRTAARLSGPWSHLCSLTDQSPGDNRKASCTEKMARGVHSPLKSWCTEWSI